MQVQNQTQDRMNFIMKHFRLKNFFSLFLFAVFGTVLWGTVGIPVSLSAQSHSVHFPAAADLPAEDPYAAAPSALPATTALPTPTASPATTALPATSTGSVPSANTAAAQGTTQEDARTVSPFREGLRTVSEEPQGTRMTTVVPAQSPQNSDFRTMDLLLGPPTSIALPGSQVILTAGVRDQTGYLRTNQRIDWRIAPESVGHFSRIQERDLSNILVFDFVRPQIISDTQAVTTTLRSGTILDRGTPNPNDDIQVRSGESWISVSSPREGVTHVSAHAPYIQSATGQSRQACIFWIDAAVKLPESKVLDFGSRYTLTTALRRNSDQQPLSRWRVRYEICGNSSAVLGNGNQMLEVYTDENGEARIEMHQTVSQEEVTRVSVQIIHPEDKNFPKPVLVQESQLNFRWKPNLVSIVKTLPENTFIGSAVPGLISVTNLTDQPIRNLRISDLALPGLTLKKAVPPGHDSPEGRQWLIDVLEPHSSYTIDLTYLVEQPGTHISYAQLQIQQMGREQTIEASAAVRAGSDTSPFTPAMPNDGPAPSAGESTPQTEALPAPHEDGTSAENALSPSTPSTPSDSQLPQPTLPNDSVYVPETDSNAGSNSNAETNSNAAADPAPKMSEIAAQSPKTAPVTPRPNPSDQIQLTLIAPAEVQTGESFPLEIPITNRTALALKNIKIYLNTSRGIHTRSSQNVYSIQRRFDMDPNVEQYIHTELLAVEPGTQSVYVKLKLPNGKEYQCEARIQVKEAPASAETPSSYSENGSGTPTQNTTDSVDDTTDSTAAPAAETPDLGETPSAETPDLGETPSAETPDLGETPSAETPDLGETPAEDDFGALPSDILPDAAASDPVPADAASPSAGPTDTQPETLPDSLELSDSLDIPTPEAAAARSPADPPDPMESPKKTTSSSPTRHSATPIPPTSPTVGELQDDDSGGNSQFSITLKASAPELRTGDLFTYTLNVTNTTNDVIRNTEIMLALPSENVEIQKDTIRGPTEVSIDSELGTLKFAPIPEIPAGEMISCQIEIKALKSGSFQAHAELFLDGKPAADKTLETTIRETESTKRN